MLALNIVRAGRHSVFNAIRLARPGRTNMLKSRNPPPTVLNRRYLSTPPPQLSQSNLTEEKYHTLSDATMEGLLDSLEVFVDNTGNPSFEVEYHSGVLTLSLGSHGTYVINKQPPNKQIWLSSPLSGPARYDYAESVDDWIYSRDGRSLANLLESEIEQMTGQPVKLGLEGPAKLVA